MPNKIDYSDVDLSDPTDWKTAEGMHEEYPQFPIRTFKYLFQNRVEKGLAPVIKKVGKTRFCNIKGFGQWLLRGARA